MNENPLASIEQMFAQMEGLKARLQALVAASTPVQSTQHVAPGQAALEAQSRLVAAYSQTPQGKRMAEGYQHAFLEWMTKNGHTKRLADETERLKTLFEASSPEATGVRQRMEMEAISYAMGLVTQVKQEDPNDGH